MGQIKTIHKETVITSSLLPNKFGSNFGANVQQRKIKILLVLTEVWIWELKELGVYNLSCKSEALSVYFCSVLFFETQSCYAVQVDLELTI